MASLSGTGPTFPLFPGEKVARFGPATGHFATRTGFPGVLHLTNQRLVFRPDGNGRLLDARLQEVRNAIPFSVKVLGIIPAGRALRVAIDTGRVSEEPWFNVDDPDAWNAAITEARAGAATPPDLSALLTPPKRKAVRPSRAMHSAASWRTSADFRAASGTPAIRTGCWT